MPISQKGKNDMIDILIKSTIQHIQENVMQQSYPSRNEWCVFSKCDCEICQQAIIQIKEERQQIFNLRTNPFLPDNHDKQDKP